MLKAPIVGVSMSLFTDIYLKMRRIIGLFIIFAENRSNGFR